MKTISKLALAAIVLSHHYAYAEGVKMYTGEDTPTAEEMADILFKNTNSPSRPKIKTRSISFSKKASTPPALPTPENAIQQAKAASIGLPIQFGYNSADILPESYTSLDEIAKLLQMPQYQHEKLLIEGHTDAAGPEDYNYYLSLQRAKAVKNYLVNRFNISANRLLTSGKGESSPLPNTSPRSPQNRRVQFYRAQ